MTGVGNGSAAPSAASGAYLRLAAIAGIVALVALVYAESAATIVAIWNDDGFTHGYLIPVISGFLLWHQRQNLAAASISPSWWGVMLVVGGAWMWLLSRQVLVQVGEHMALIVMMHGLVMALLGWRMYTHAAFALAYLVLAVPAGLETVPWLMELTAELSHRGLLLLGIPTLREEMFFMLPGGRFEVAEACSGFRFVFSGFALALLVAYLDLQGWRARVLFVSFAVVCFVLLNSVRATAIMAIASASDMRYLATNHEWFGWLLFGLVFIGLYGLAQWSTQARQAA